jgi:predicted MFS family arabinose efflux permease
LWTNKAKIRYPSYVKERKRCRCAVCPTLISPIERIFISSILSVSISLYLTPRADRIGRRRMLIVGSILMAAAGLVFDVRSSLFFLVIAGTIGVISPSGNEVGPFLSIEQAALSHIVPAAARTEVAWYTLAGSLAIAFGASVPVP